MTAPLPHLSVVVPLFNEEDSVARLVAAVAQALEASESWELILVDDGSTDRTVTIAEGIAANDDRVRLIRMARNYGQTPAMQAGFDHARGEVVVDNRAPRPGIAGVNLGIGITVQLLTWLSARLAPELALVAAAVVAAWATVALFRRS